MSDHLAQWGTSLGGGLLIGLASVLLLLFNGRVAGISGIAGRLLAPARGETAWRAAFLAGLLGGALLVRAGAPQAFGAGSPAPLWALAPAGLLVGYGTRLANGCTSGHGVCGLGRRSPRSLAAVATFMAVAAAVVFVARHALPWGRA